LYYRIVALRSIKKPDGTTQWAPSQPSKLLLTTMIDTVNPESPEITATSTAPSPAVVSNVILSWHPTAYNGKYYLEKMTATGTWQTIYTFASNATITVNLQQTTLASADLPKQAPNGRPLFHRFRVRAENSSGLFSLVDRVLTL